MILIDREQKSLDELSAVLGVNIPLEKLMNAAIFEINPALVKKDPANGPYATRVPAGEDWPAFFRVKLKRGGKDVEIRYCTNRQPNPANDGKTELFAPRHVSFTDEAELIANDDDKAVFFWLHTFNEQSPFRDKTKPFRYQFVDNQARAKVRIESIKSKREAMAYADTLNGDALMIIAKGLRIPGAHAMDEDTLKAELSERALQSPEAFMAKAKSQVTQIEGLIIDAIDKGIFVSEVQFNTRKWLWGAGAMKGQLIADMPSNVQDSHSALITHIQSRINEYWPTLMSTVKNMNAQAKAQDFLENVDVLKEMTGSTFQEEPEEQEDVYVPPTAPRVDNDGKPLPTNFKEAKQYLFDKNGKHSSPKDISEFLKMCTGKEEPEEQDA